MTELGPAGQPDPTTSPAADRSSGLRRMRPGDIDAVLALETSLFARSAWSRGMFTEELGAAGRHYTVAETAGRIIGYAGIAVAATSQVMTIGVDPSQRRRGWGAALLQDLLTAADEARTRDVILEVRADHPSPQRLYRRFGFEQIGLRRQYYRAEGADAVVMQLHLRTGPGPIGAEL